MSFFFCMFAALAAERRPLIIDHDAGVDDLGAIAIAHRSGRFRIDAITIAPADSFKASAIQITTGLAHFLGLKASITAGDNEGVHHFPDPWREDSRRMARIPELKPGPGTFDSTPAPRKLVEVLSRGTRYEILATGPLSNVADALKLDPSIAKNIARIYFMGGAVHVGGNVRVPGHDGTAEWNVYNNPRALADVLAAGIPMTMVALDATNAVPVTKEFMRGLAAQDRFPTSRLFHQVWSVIAGQIESPTYHTTYFFWDTLTAAFAANPALGETTTEKIKVILSGASEGRTVTDPGGYPVQLLRAPRPKPLADYILGLFRT